MKRILLLTLLLVGCALDPEPVCSVTYTCGDIVWTLYNVPKDDSLRVYLQLEDICNGNPGMIP